MNSAVKTVSEGSKVFYIQYKLGTVKYAVSFHDGIKTHKDGSPFFDIATFKDHKSFNKFTSSLVKSGYTLN